MRAGLAEDGTYQGRVQGSTPNKPEVKVEPGQRAGAQGLLTTMAPAPADKKHRASRCVRELRWHCS